MQVKIEDLFNEMGYDPELMVADCPIDVSELGYEIETWNVERDRREWSLIKHIVVKDDADGYSIPEFDLTVSAFHRFWASVDKGEPGWIEARDLVGRRVRLLDSSGTWRSCTVMETNERTRILDIEVEGTNSYFSNGVLSHNTLYGDPDTTPGGQALPFHASVRIKLTSGTQIKSEEEYNKGDIIGINVIATTVKNKVASPRRKANFEIHFGIGIKEEMQIFEEIQRKGPVEVDDMIIECGGGQKKTLTVASATTGEVIHEYRFYKKDFPEVWVNPKHKKYIDMLMDATFIKEHRRPTLESELSAEEEMMNESKKAVEEPVSGVTGA